APALLVGNAVVLKPSEFIPTVGEAIRELLEPLPPGVATVVQGGPEVGAALVDAPCDKVCLIGSAATARKVMEVAARHLTPVVFELGGQDTAIVCEDADLEVAASGILWGAFLNAGQTCCAVERVYVVEGVADRFAELLVSKLGRLRTGPAAGPEADVGPLSVPRQFEKVDALVRDAVRQGARVLAGGPPEAPGTGLWYPPTVVEGRSEEMAIFREETFGPLLPLVRVRDEEEAVRRANEEGFNLTASVWTRDRARARRLAARLRAGAVSVNDHGSIAGTPWGMWGGVGQSGFGRLNGEVGIREFAVPVHVGENLLPRLKRLWWYPYDEPTARALRALTDLLAAPGWAARWEAAWTLVREGRRALRAKL
ncbi:MAG TPA: aldehyde dehydrogenase family protein, partial [Actinomycetota bacterium]|nr:aldehyde dehydrogenase family protein [Actinomycetota bacterium]